MSSTTSRVSLYKPAGGENVNVTTDLNNNWDKVDSNLNFRVAANAAARNAISPYWAGINVRDTDTGKLWVSNGTAPISGSWKEIPVQDSTFGSDLDITAGKQINIGGSSSVASFATSLAASGDDAIASRVSTDTQSRYLVKADGKTWWGPGGSTAIDTNLYRDSASVLATDDEFMIKGGNLILTSGGTAEINTWPSASTTVANTTSESLLATFTIPASDAIAGAVYKLTAWGTASTTGTPTLNIKAKLGGLAGTAIGQTGNVTSASGASLKPWKAEAYVVCLTNGASATWFGNLTVTCGWVLGAGVFINPSQTIDGTTQFTLDSTVSRDLVLTATWSAASASNTVTTRGYSAQRVA